MNNVIANLALLKAMLDSDNTSDYLSLFVPFLATLISKNKYETLNANDLVNDFEKEYGFSIPYYPMKVLLNSKYNICKVKDRACYPNYEKISTIVHDENKKAEINAQLSNFTSAFKNYALKEFNRNITDENLYNDIITFLDRTYIDIIKKSFKATDFQDDNYILARFILYCNENSNEHFKFITDFCMGYFIKNALNSYTDDRVLNGERIDLKKLNIYIDTNFILPLIGIDYFKKQSIYKSLVDALQAYNVTLSIFRHTFEEVIQLLEGSLSWLTYNYNYDETKASITTKFFKEGNYKNSDVELIISTLEVKLADFKINITELPKYENVSKKFLIDEADLHNIILNTYARFSFNKDGLNDKDNIEKDVKSISAIYRLRKDEKTTTINKVNHIFLTTSNTLACSNKEYVNKHNENESMYIPTVITDVYLGTIIWLREPMKLKDMNIKSLIADCYCALRPDHKLIRKYVCDLENEFKGGNISEKDFILLKESTVSKNLLSYKTLSNPDNYTSEMIRDILEEIKNIAKFEASQEYEKDKEHFSKKIELVQEKYQNEAAKSMEKDRDIHEKSNIINSKNKEIEQLKKQADDEKRAKLKKENEDRELKREKYVKNKLLTWRLVAWILLIVIGLLWFLFWYLSKNYIFYFSWDKIINIILTYFPLKLIYDRHLNNSNIKAYKEDQIKIPDDLKELTH